MNFYTIKYEKRDIGLFKSVRPITSARKFLVRICKEFELIDEEVCLVIRNVKTNREYKYVGMREKCERNLVFKDKYGEPKIVKVFYRYKIKRLPD